MMSNRLHTSAPENSDSPIRQAAAALGENLRELKHISNGGRADLRFVAHSVSEAYAYLIEIKDPRRKSMALAASINTAMNHLRDALSALQSISLESTPGLENAARTVAKVLALLYPLSKFEHSETPRPSTHNRSQVPDNIAERRHAERIPVDAEVGFQSDTNFFMGFSEDISTGGLFIATFDTRPLGAVMNLNFTLPDGHLISVDGVVRWIREYNDTSPDVTPGMGVQFENLRREDKVAIEHFITERPAMFYDDE